MNIPLDEWSGAGATKALHKTIKEFVESTEKQTRTMIRLTRWITGLTIAMLIAVAAQIAIAKQWL